MRKLFLLILFFCKLPAALDFDEKIENFILENPEVILQSLENYEKKKTEELEEQNTKKIDELKNLLYQKTDLYSGNPLSQNVIIEFLDYNCSYCKLLHKNILKLQKEKNVKIIYKNFPILSDNSLIFAKIAIILAKEDNEKFNDFHNFLLSSKNEPSTAEVKNFLSKQDFDFDEIKKKFSEDYVLSSLELHKELALELKLQGTPALIINNKLFFGYIDYDEILKILKI